MDARGSVPGVFALWRAPAMALPRMAERDRRRNRRGTFGTSRANTVSSVTARTPAISSVQSRQCFRVAHIGPFTTQFNRFHFFTRLSEFADRVCQFVFAAW